MNIVPPDLQETALLLLAHEGSPADAPGAEWGEAMGVCLRLRQPLVIFAGTEGFRSLLARALTLARVKEPALAALEVEADGTLKVIGDDFDAKAAKAGATLLVGQLLNLLTTFIGQSLTAQMVQRAWPELENRTSGKGNL